MLSKDEVDSSFDVTVSVDLVACLSKKGVLVPIKTNAIVALLSVISSESNGLRALSVRVFDVDVVELSILSEIDDSTSVFIIGSSTEKARAVCDRNYIAGIRRCVGSVSIDCECSRECRNSHLFRVSARINEYALRAR